MSDLIRSLQRGVNFTNFFLNPSNLLLSNQSLASLLDLCLEVAKDG